MKSKTDNQRGVALLATLMSIALMTVLVIDFTYSVSAAYRSAANQMNELRADYLARSGVQVGLALLAQDARTDAETNQPFDSLQDVWAMPFPPVPVEGGSAGVSIIDETGKMNINLLVDQNTGVVNQVVLQQLSRLFALVEVPPEIIPAIVDWLDRDSVTSEGGAESDYYLGLIPPYQPRNGPMPTLGDLKMVRGVNEASFARLRRVLTTQPVGRPNINTAPAEVLMALSPELANDPSIVKTLLAAREVKPLRSITDLTEIRGVSSIGAKLSGLFTTKSDYFTVTGLGAFAGARKIVYASVRRNGTAPLMLANWHED
jgi:general secretion pathway protein K